ncbi:hypothetical protein K491DRAFT_683509 [Lophiostoma macrostomum CBS 122681]|uniref:Uncharacterized protein n=1 Tax=Lophiostoma macrostomum CBS 122681 TaxID=1314788 RepID=A0A6A6STQ6_9PLEO|nr:hypothetical protein K491DRAFT_683509 [Lophiostoma macrostomum CBS 122681]
MLDACHPSARPKPYDDICHCLVSRTVGLVDIAPPVKSCVPSGESCDRTRRRCGRDLSRGRGGGVPYARRTLEHSIMDIPSVLGLLVVTAVWGSVGEVVWKARVEGMEAKWLYRESPLSTQSHSPFTPSDTTAIRLPLDLFTACCPFVAETWAHNLLLLFSVLARRSARLPGVWLSLAGCLRLILGICAPWVALQSSTGKRRGTPPSLPLLPHPPAACCSETTPNRLPHSSLRLSHRWATLHNMTETPTRATAVPAPYSGRTCGIALEGSRECAAIWQVRNRTPAASNPRERDREACYSDSVHTFRHCTERSIVAAIQHYRRRSKTGDT